MECVIDKCQIVIDLEKELELACGEIVKNCQDGFVDLCPLWEICDTEVKSRACLVKLVAYFVAKAEEKSNNDR